jgi:hypothetical protein
MYNFGSSLRILYQKKIFSDYRLWFYEIIKNLIMNLTLEADVIKDIKC